MLWVLSATRDKIVAQTAGQFICTYHEPSKYKQHYTRAQFANQHYLAEEDIKHDQDSDIRMQLTWYEHTLAMEYPVSWSSWESPQIPHLTAATDAAITRQTAAVTRLSLIIAALCSKH